MSTVNANESERRQFCTQRALAMGAEYPFDARAEWDEHGDRVSPPPPVDWAHAAARGVIADLSDRRGIKDSLHAVDVDVRVGIVQSIADIIRSAAQCNGIDDQVRTNVLEELTMLSRLERDRMGSVSAHILKNAIAQLGGEVQS